MGPFKTLISLLVLVTLSALASQAGMTSTQASTSGQLLVLLRDASALAIVDPEKPWIVDRRKMEASAGNTPFDGQPTQGRVIALFKGGVAVSL